MELSEKQNANPIVYTVRQRQQRKENCDFALLDNEGRDEFDADEIYDILYNNNNPCLPTPFPFPSQLS